MTRFSYIPTSEMLSSNFTTITSPACNGGRQIALKGSPFVNNMISPALFSAPALKMLTYYGTTSDPCGRVQFGSINNQDEQTGTGRADYQVNAKHTIFGRYYGTHAYLPPTYTGSPLSITATSPDDLVTSVVLGDTYILGPKTINSFRGTFVRSSIIKTQVPTFGPSDLGIIGVTELVPHFFTATVSGAGTAPFSRRSVHHYAPICGRPQPDPWLAPIAIWHKLHSPGFQRLHHRRRIRLVQLYRAEYKLVYGRFSAGHSGQLRAVQPNYDFERHQFIGLYAQDSWRINSRLLVNYGVRWEPLISAIIQHGQVTHFDPAAFNQNIHSTIYPNAPVGMPFPGDAGFDTGGRPSNIRWNDFAPRLGVVWDPKGDGRMTVRASWGMFYDLPNTMFFYSYSGSPPWGSSVSYLNPPGGFQNPWLGYPGGNPFPVRLSSK
jgi:hypothetical protein